MALTKVSTGVVDMSTSTGGLVIAKGNDLERPASPSIGMIRESTETIPSKVEVYTDNGGAPDWQFLEEVGPTRVPLTVDYLVIAGGGSGGEIGGGGGAGGFRTSFGTGNINGGLQSVENSLSLSLSTPYSITVGAGGIPSGAQTTPSGSGGNSILSTFVESIGGGGGGSYISDGASGGSGGGGSSGGSVQSGGLRASNPIQGFNGGANSLTSPYPAGGGGGAYSIGVVGNGGSAMESSITGTPTDYAGGGGGGNQRGYYGGSTSLYLGGGGGAGDGSGTSTGQPATNNTGSGGGGGGFTGTYYVGGSGGSGVVILRYPSSYTINTTQIGSALSVTNDNSVSGYTITTIICASTATGTGTIQFT